MQPTASGTLRLSTESLAPKSRDETLREFYGRLLLRMDIAPFGDEPVRIDAQAKLLPGVTIMRVQTSPSVRERTPDLLVDGVDDILLSTSSAGYEVALASGDVVEAAPGDVLVTAFNHRARYVTREPALLRTIRVPRSTLTVRGRQLCDRPVHTVSGSAAAMRLLFDYARLVAESAAVSAQAGHTLAYHLIDLVALALGDARQTTELANGRGVRAARLAAAKNAIAAQLTSPSLSAELVAARLRVSARYVRKLFEHEGVSFSEYVTAERLALVHRRLVNPQESARIATLAFDAGFNEVATFNRLFRRRYGMTPSDVREGRR